MAANRVRLAAGLDVGSAFTRCVICLIEDGRIRFLGAGEVESRGWTNSKIAHREQMSESVRLAAREAERQAGVSIDAVVVGLGGETVRGDNQVGKYDFGRPREIDQSDMAYAVEKACRQQLDADRVLLQVFPQDFTLDGNAGVVNPRGTRAARLEANVHIVTTSAFEHQALVSAVHEAHLAVEETVYEGMASAYACVTQDERRQGVAIADIGAQSTEIVVYAGEAMVQAVTIRVGGEHFTRDIAHDFKISFEDAEKIKHEYGCAILGLTADNTFIEVPSAEGRPAREAPRKRLNYILESRADFLFRFIKKHLADCGMDGHLLEGILLTGGGACLPGMCDVAELVLNCQSRNGLPVGIQDWPDSLFNPRWTTVAGLAMYSGRLKEHRYQKRSSPGFLSLLMSK
jgi:cell division protein FtsA